MRTATLEPKTLDQILEVIRIAKSNYTAGLPIDHSYQDAINKVATKYNVAYQTIGDGCRRRLNLINIKEFRDLLEGYYSTNNPNNLISLLKQHTNSKGQHEKIMQFFKMESDKEIDLEAVTPLVFSSKKVDEVISFRLSQESARQLKAISSLQGMSVSEWVAETIKKSVEQELKNWARSYSGTDRKEV